MKLPLQNVLRQSARYLTGMAIMTSLTTMAVAFDPVTTRNCSWVAFDGVNIDKSEAVCLYGTGTSEKVFVGGQTSAGNIFLAGYQSEEHDPPNTQKSGNQFWKDSQFANFPGEIVDFVLDSSMLYAIGYFTGTKVGLESELPGATVYDLIKSSGGGQEVIVIEFNLTDPEPEPQKVWILGGNLNDYGLSGDLSGSTLFIGGTAQSTNFEDPYLGGGVSGVYNGFIASLDISTPPSVDVVRLDGQANKATVYTGVHVYGSNVYASSNTYETDFEDPVAELIKFPVSLTSVTEYGIVSGNDYEELREIDVDSSGNIIVAGTTFGTTEDLYVASYSTTGTQNWDEVYSYGTTYHDKAYGVTLDSSNNIYVAGHTQDYNSWTDGQGASEVILLKYNSSGVYQSVKTYGNRSQTVGYEGTGYDVAVNSSGDAFIAGNATSRFEEIYITSNEHSDDGRDITLIRSHNNYSPGTASDDSWAAFDSDCTENDEGEALAVYDGDTFFVGGKTSNGKIYLSQFQSGDVDATKKQEHGVLQWRDSLVGSLPGKITDLIVDSTDLYAIAQVVVEESILESMYPDVDVNNQTSTGGEEDILVIRYDLTGTSPEVGEIWMLGGSNKDLVEAGVLYNGSLFLAGSTFSTEFEGSSAIQSVSNVYNGFLASIHLINNTIDTEFEGLASEDKQFSDICEYDDGIYAVLNTYTASATSPLSLNPSAELFKVDDDLNGFGGAFPIAIDSGGNTEIVSVDVSDIGTVVVSGTAKGTYNDIYLASFDSDGNDLWDAKYSHESDTADDYGYGMAIDPDGFVYVVGETGDPENKSCMLQVVYAPEGHLISVTTYGNRGEEQEDDHNGAAYDVAVNQYGDTFLVGEATSYFNRLYNDTVTPLSKDRNICLIQSKASIFQQNGEPFYPIGFNYTLVSSCTSTANGSTKGTHFVDFHDDVFDLVKIDQDFTKMSTDGFNVVRIGLHPVEVMTISYIENMAEFINKAQEKGILVHLVTYQFPHSYIANFSQNDSDPNVEYYRSSIDLEQGVLFNYMYFGEDDTFSSEFDHATYALEGSVRFWKELVQNLQSAAGDIHDNDEPTFASSAEICDNLIIEPYNEPYFDVQLEPFSKPSGTIFLDGEVEYKWSTTDTVDQIQSEKTDLADHLARRWATKHADVLEGVDPDILVGASPYTNHDRGCAPSHLDVHGQRNLEASSGIPLDIWKNTDSKYIDKVLDYSVCDGSENKELPTKRPVSYEGLLKSSFDWVGGNIYLDRYPYTDIRDSIGYEKYADRRSELLAKGMLSTNLDGLGLNQPIMSAEFGYFAHLADPLSPLVKGGLPRSMFYYDDDDLYPLAADTSWLQTELLRRYRFRGFNLWGWDVWIRYYEGLDDDGEVIGGDDQYRRGNDGYCLCDPVGSTSSYNVTEPALGFDALYGATNAIFKVLSPKERSGTTPVTLDALNTSVEDIDLIRSYYRFDPPDTLSFYNGETEDVPAEVFFYQTGNTPQTFVSCLGASETLLGNAVYRGQANLEGEYEGSDGVTDVNLADVCYPYSNAPLPLDSSAICVYYVTSKDPEDSPQVLGSHPQYSYCKERDVYFEFGLTGDKKLHLLHPGSRGEDVADISLTISGVTVTLDTPLAPKEYRPVSLSLLFGTSAVAGSYTLVVESIEKDSSIYQDNHAVKIVAGCTEEGGSRNCPVEATVDTVLSYSTTSSSDLIGYTPEIADCYTTPSVSLMGHWIEVDVPAGRKISVTSREIDLYGVAVGIYSETGDTLLACDYSDSSTVTEATATWSNSGTATATVLILANHHADSNLAEVEIECFPINDDCADATEVFCGTSLDGWFLEGATRDGSCTCAGTLVDVWYKIEIPFSGTKVQADYTRNASFGYVALFTGTCGSLTEQSCGPLSTSFTTSADAQTVYIRLSAFGVTAEQGLDIICTSPTTPSNDERTGSASISCGYSMSGVITNGASVSTSPVANPCAIATAKDVWFRYDTPAGYPSATLNQGYGPEVTIEFEDDHLYGNPSSSYSGFIAIYEGTRLVDYRCNRTAADATGKFTLTVKLGPSLPYYIRIGSDSPSPDKYFSFSCNSKLP
jgi:Beta-propeller repeat